MKIQTKMLKKLIAVLCAATMVASGAVASVGAVSKEEIAQAQGAANDCIKKVKDLEEKKKKLEQEMNNDEDIRYLKMGVKDLEEKKKKLELERAKYKKNKNNLMRAERFKLTELTTDLTELQSKITKNRKKFAKKIKELEKAIENAKKEESRLNKLVKDLTKQAEREKERLEKEKQEQNKNQNVKESNSKLKEELEFNTGRRNENYDMDDDDNLNLAFPQGENINALMSSAVFESKQLKDQKATNKATNIQKIFRGHMARKRVEADVLENIKMYTQPGVEAKDELIAYQTWRRQRGPKGDEEAFKSLKRNTLFKIYLIKDINQYIRDIRFVNGEYSFEKYSFSFAKANNKEDIKNEIQHLDRYRDIGIIREFAKKQIEEDRINAMYEELGLSKLNYWLTPFGVGYLEKMLKICDKEIEKVENKDEKEAIAKLAKLRGHRQELNLSLENEKALERLTKVELIEKNKVKEAEDRYNNARLNNSALRDRYNNAGIFDYFTVLRNNYQIAREKLSRVIKAEMGGKKLNDSFKELRRAYLALKEANTLQAAEKKAWNKLQEAIIEEDDKVNKAKCEYDKLKNEYNELRKKNCKEYVDNQIRTNKSLAELAKFYNYCKI